MRVQGISSQSQHWVESQSSTRDISLDGSSALVSVRS